MVDGVELQASGEAALSPSAQVVSVEQGQHTTTHSRQTSVRDVIAALSSAEHSEQLALRSGASWFCLPRPASLPAVVPTRCSCGAAGEWVALWRGAAAQAELEAKVERGSCR